MGRNANYRMTAASGLFDERADTADDLIREASRLHGCFTLWQWNGRQWCKRETFIF